jgi:hypothetical protein
MVQIRNALIRIPSLLWERGSETPRDTKRPTRLFLQPVLCQTWIAHTTQNPQNSARTDSYPYTTTQDRGCGPLFPVFQPPMPAIIKHDYISVTRGIRQSQASSCFQTNHCCRLSAPVPIRLGSGSITWL